MMNYYILETLIYFDDGTLFRNDEFGATQKILPQSEKWSNITMGLVYRHFRLEARLRIRSVL